MNDITDVEDSRITHAREVLKLNVKESHRLMCQLLGIEEGDKAKDAQVTALLESITNTAILAVSILQAEAASD